MPCRSPRLSNLQQRPTSCSFVSSLDAYYIFIHPFFPILPPPSSIPFDQAVPHLQNHVEDFEDGFEPSSPISLAISAILALIPCANDVDHLSHESIVFRRKYSQYLAQSAVESIEIENEIPDSSVEPPRALSESPVDPPRQPFHPLVPLELESIITLDLLSVYEYAQRGNLKKMQNRAGQALVSAMALSIHACSDEDDVFYEAKRRVWWMTVRAPQMLDTSHLFYFCSRSSSTYVSARAQ